MPTLDEVKTAVLSGPTAEPAPETPKRSRKAAEPAAAEPAAAEPAAAEPAAEPAELKRYTVQLRDNPAVTVEAADRLDAIAVYKTRLGILRTEHEFRVSLARD